MRREQALKILAGQRETLYSRYSTDTLSVFGSVARDETSEGSDVDILEAIDRINRYTQDMDYSGWQQDEKTVDAVIRKSLGSYLTEL